MEGQETALGEAASVYRQDGKGGYLRAVLVKHVGGGEAADDVAWRSERGGSGRSWRRGRPGGGEVHRDGRCR